MTAEEKVIIDLLEKLRAEAAHWPRGHDVREGLLSISDVIGSMERFLFRESVRKAKLARDIDAAKLVDVAELEQRHETLSRIRRFFDRHSVRFANEFERYWRGDIPPSNLDKLKRAVRRLTAFLDKDEHRPG